MEIGHKLIDHFRNLAVPSEILRASTRQPSEDGELEIMAAIINIFHLLPHPAAEVFLESVITAVVDVERHLKKLKTSIFTKPLAKYLQLYPTEAVKLFFAHLGDARYVQTFRAVLASEWASEVRAQITARPNELIGPALGMDGDIGYHAALVMKELVKVDPSWIVNAGEDVSDGTQTRRQPTLELLINRWVSDIRRQRLLMEGDPHFQQLREDAVMVEIFLAYLEQAQHIDLLFHIVDSYTFWNSANHTVLSRFLNKHVALSTNVPFKRAILDRFVEIFENTAVPKAHKTAALRILVNPILLISFSRGAKEADLVRSEFVFRVHQKLWQPLLTVVPDLASFEDEAMRVELCHMATLMVRAYSHLVADNKKDVIKFGWVNIKLEDITVKQAAYILIASFLQRYESPSKILLQIYVALLKAHQPEARQLVREALDILVPSMPKRNSPNSTSSNPQDGALYWAKWTRKILVEDSSSMPLLLNIYQLIVRHPDQFYPTRELFVPHMVASLAKLTLGSTVTPDTRILTLDVTDLILKWERKRIELAKKEKEEEAKMEVDATAEGMEVVQSPKRGKVDRAPSAAPSTTSGGGPNAGYAVPSNLRDQVINNLLRFISNSSEALMRSNLVSRALALLKELIGPNVWSDIHVKLSFFQRTFATNEVADDTLVTLCNSAEVLNVVSSYKPAEWHLSNIGVLHMIIEKGYASTEFRLHTALRPVLERVFDALPPATIIDSPEAAPEVVAFVDWAKAIIKEGLATLSNLPAAMLVLQSWAKASPERVDDFFQALIRVFSRFTKEHISATSPVSSSDPQLRLLVSSLEILRQRVSHLGEHRRWFLSAIVQLVEKSSNIDVCRFLLQMTRKWVTDKEEPHPTNKEKAGILLKMMSYETRGSEALMKDFLTLILDIYTDPTLTRSELTTKLEPAFLLGCKNRDPVIRSKFLSVFDKSLATGLFSRLHYVLGVQSWETLGETYWMHQALDLVLGAVEPDQPLFAGTISPKAEQSFVEQLQSYKSGELMEAARKLLYADPLATHALWISTFKSSWICLSRREQLDMTKFIVSLITKEYHLRAVDRRPNVIQTLLAGVLACSPTPTLPPHVIRYLSKTFNAWHTGIELLQEALETPREEESIRESTVDALAETYSELSEEDLLYGLWRRRAGYNETNAAIR